MSEANVGKRVPWKNALVTGASGGLGRELALELARQGVYVVLAARREAELQAALEALKAEGGEGEALVLDVGDTAGTVEAIQALDARLGGLELVIANAAQGKSVSGKRMTFAEVAPMYQVNLLGAVATLTAALPAMVSRGRGHVVGISSLAAFMPVPKNGPYASSKAGLSSFLESLRMDLKGTGVTVTTVHPGFIRTPMTAPNKHVMPFIVEADEAARRIVQGLTKAPAYVNFPAGMVVVTWVLNRLPRSVYEAIFAGVMGKGKRPAEPTPE